MIAKAHLVVGALLLVGCASASPSGAGSPPPHDASPPDAPGADASASPDAPVGLDGGVSADANTNPLDAGTDAHGSDAGARVDSGVQAQDSGPTCPAREVISSIDGPGCQPGSSTDPRTWAPCNYGGCGGPKYLYACGGTGKPDVGYCVRAPVGLASNYVCCDELKCFPFPAENILCADGGTSRLFFCPMNGAVPVAPPSGCAALSASGAGSPYASFCCP